MSTASIPPVVLPKHRNTGIAVAVGCVLLALLILFIFTFEMADPPPREIPMNTTTSLTDLEIKDLKVETGGAGGGTPSNDPIHEPTPQTEKILTKKKNDKSSSNTGESNKTNANNHTNTATTTTQSDDPFATGGEGGGYGGGRGGKFGKDDGNNEGKGKSVGIRILDVPPIAPGIDVEGIKWVRLKLLIDENGIVLNAINYGKSDANQLIINRIIRDVYKNVRYTKDPNTNPRFQWLTVKVTPSTTTYIE
jgi:hypothetical protein